MATFDYSEVTHLLDGVPTGIRLGHEDTPATGNGTFEVEDPATGEVIAKVADAQSADWMRALELADAVRDEWTAVAPRTRADILREIFDRVMDRADDFATLMTLEMGKTYADAKAEVTYGADYLRWFGEEAVRMYGNHYASPAGNGSITTSLRPVGPALAITPWNFPLAMPTRKIGPALAAGCPIIVKPAKESPLTMLLFGQIATDVLKEYDVPSGVISIVPSQSSTDLSRELMADPRLRKVTFTGSTAVGKKLVEQSAENLQRTSMELGGNAPYIVHRDADLDEVIEGAKTAKMRGGGEVCIAANRFIVHEDIAAEFADRMVEMMESYTRGHGLAEGTTQGPLVSAKQRDQIAELVDAARDAGATIRTGGAPIEGEGYFYPATVITDIPDDADILRQEIFGPVATITTYSDVEEAVRKANDTEFGLAAYAFSKDFETSEYFARHLDAGMVGINRAGISDAAAPFGGVKFSGFGREGGPEGIHEYVEVHYIAKP